MPQVWCGNQVVDVPVGHPCTLADLLAAFQIPRGYIRFRNDPQGAPLITMPFELLPTATATAKQEEGGNEGQGGGGGDQEEIAFELVSLASLSTSSSAAAIGSQDAKRSATNDARRDLEEEDDALGNEMELLEEVARHFLALASGLASPSTRWFPSCPPSSSEPVVCISAPSFASSRRTRQSGGGACQGLWFAGLARFGRLGVVLAMFEWWLRTSEGLG